MTKNVDHEHPGQLGSAAPGIREYRFAILLGALTLMMVSSPIIRAFASGLGTTLADITVAILFSFVVLSAVFAVSRNRKQQVVALLLAAPAVVVQGVYAWRPSDGVAVASHLVGILFLTYAVVLVVRFLFSGDRVTADMIFASLCVYLLLGVAWAIAYSLIEHLEPGSFVFSVVEGGDADLMRFGGERTFIPIYYSLVTMSTLGYGDIIPTSSSARACAALQAVVGPLYLTVLVARLVGLHVSQASEKEQEARK